MSLQTLIEVAQSMYVGAPEETDYPHAMLEDDTGGVHVMPLMLGDTAACLRAIHNAARECNAQAAVWASEGWATNANAAQWRAWRQQYGSGLRIDQHVPADQRWENVIIYGEDVFGLERYLEWRIDGEPPNRVYTPVDTDDWTRKRLSFRPLLPRPGQPMRVNLSPFDSSGPITGR